MSPPPKLSCKTLAYSISPYGDIEYAKVLHDNLGGGDIVSFHATKTTNEIADMISSSHGLLMFSNYENFPCVIAESMMSGKPIISSNVNGIPEHVLPEFGVLVNPGLQEHQTQGEHVQGYRLHLMK